MAVTSFLPWFSWGTGLKPPGPPIEAHRLQLLGNRHCTSRPGQPKKRQPLTGTGSETLLILCQGVPAGWGFGRSALAREPVHWNGLRPIAWVLVSEMSRSLVRFIPPTVLHSVSRVPLGEMSEECCKV